MTSKRFTAVIKIIEVTERTATTGFGRDQKTDVVSHDTELANIVVRAGSLETIKSDIAAHVALVKDMSHGANVEV